MSEAPSNAEIEAARQAVLRRLRMRLCGPNGEWGVFETEAEELARAALEAAAKVRHADEGITHADLHTPMTNFKGGIKPSHPAPDDGWREIASAVREWRDARRAFAALPPLTLGKNGWIEDSAMHLRQEAFIKLGAAEWKLPEASKSLPFPTISKGTVT